MAGYNTREILARIENHPSSHTTACLTATVDSYLDDTPDPGCTCPPEIQARKVARIEELFNA